MWDRSTFIFVAGVLVGVFWGISLALGFKPEGAILAYSGTLMLVSGGLRQQERKQDERKQRRRPPDPPQPDEANGT